MGVEIERKFLVDHDAWKNAREESHVTSLPYVQGYLCSETDRTVRVRTAGERAMITIKGRTQNASRPEYEYEIPKSDALELLQLCAGPLIEKVRFRVPHDGHVWEVDEFSSLNQGLIVAEIELDARDESFSKPSWLGTEVTGDSRYSNSSLVRSPFTRW